MDTTCASSSFDQNFRGGPRDEALARLKRVSRFYTLFHLGFLTLAIGELLAFLLFFTLFTKSAILAFSIAGIFLTGFSYFVLLFYFQAKKPEQLMDLKEEFLSRCKEGARDLKGTTQYHAALTHEIYRFVHLLDGQEYRFYRLPKFLEALNPVLQKFSSWSHWKDTHEMKEKLLMAAIGEQVEQVKLQPTDLEAHASLASAYLKLARVYKDPRELSPEGLFPWISPEYAGEEMAHKFKRAAERAIQEYLILDAYAPRQLWTQAQLAAIYRDLDRPEEEMACYERMHTIAPSDQEVLFRLGVLYFEEGLNAKALRIYETLKESGSEKTDLLIAHYDAHPLKP